MKKLLIPIYMMAILVVLAACGSDDEKGYTCSSCVTAPEAVAANDNLAKGVYKGVVLGSSGIIKFVIENGTSGSQCIITVDGVTATLTTDAEVVADQGFEATFTGTFNGQPISIGFYVESDGSDPYVTYADIPGHPDADIGIVKELSDALIECFEGTYKGSSSGTLNVVVSRDQSIWGAIADDDYIEGIISGNTLTGTNVDGDVAVTGTLGDQTISGTWQADNGDKGTWEAKRTL